MANKIFKIYSWCELQKHKKSLTLNFQIKCFLGCNKKNAMRLKFKGNNFYY